MATQTKTRTEKKVSWQEFEDFVNPRWSTLTESPDKTSGTYYDPLRELIATFNHAQREYFIYPIQVNGYQ